MAEPLLEPLLRWWRYRLVLRHGVIPRGSRVCDIGCGRSATFLRVVASSLKEGVGLDADVTEWSEGHTRTIRARVDRRLPFPDHAFDVVTMLAVLEHMEHDGDVLREVSRILRPGGRLVLTVPSWRAKPVLEFLAYRLGVVSEAHIREHKRYYDRTSLHELLVRQAEFTDFAHRYFQCGMNNFCVCVKALSAHSLADLSERL